MKYEVVMGLEVHCELSTNTKIFCSCSTSFESSENENVCPGCGGMPGTLPVMNRRVVEYGIKAALVTNCKINQYCTFDKKNYFYPDLSCSYQITQLFHPICVDGFVEIETEAGKKKISLKQIHMEEDAGKLKHDAITGNSLVDFNRCSVPLLEIVSNPDFRTAEEVLAYLEKLRSMLRFIGISDCKMQEGSMRCDVNLSVRPAGTTELGTRTEIKNMASLKAISRAIAYEIERHIDAIDSGNGHTLIQETRRWDDAAGKSYSMRSKENAQDYRYFPNPDLPPIEISDEWIAEVKNSLPELADAKLARYMDEFGLPEYDCRLLTSSKTLCEIFEKCTSICNQPKETSNWIIGELMSAANNEAKAYDDLRLDGAKLASLINLVAAKIINRNTAKKVFAEIYANDTDPEEYVKQHGLAMVSDTGAIEAIVDQVIAENQSSVEDYRKGKTQAQGFLMGKVMKLAKGKADPQLVNELLNSKLNG